MAISLFSQSHATNQPTLPVITYKIKKKHILMNFQIPRSVSVQLTTVLGPIPYDGGFSFQIMTPQTDHASFSVLMALWFLVYRLTFRPRIYWQSVRPNYTARHSETTVIIARYFGIRLSKPTATTRNQRRNYWLLWKFDSCCRLVSSWTLSRIDW